MTEADLRGRAEPAADGFLYLAYHLRMRAVHDRNARRLTQILVEHG